MSARTTSGVLLRCDSVWWSGGVHDDASDAAVEAGGGGDGAKPAVEESVANAAAADDASGGGGGGERKLTFFFFAVGAANAGSSCGGGGEALPFFFAGGGGGSSVSDGGAQPAHFGHARHLHHGQIVLTDLSPSHHLVHEAAFVSLETRSLRAYETHWSAAETRGRRRRWESMIVRILLALGRTRGPAERSLRSGSERVAEEERGV